MKIFPARASRAFTLIELLTVIAIIGILAAILIPTVGKVRAQAKRSVCTSNVRQLGVATLLYADENKGFGPLGDGSAMTTLRRGNSPLLFGYLLPYLSIKAPATITDLKTTPDIFICPGSSPEKYDYVTKQYPGAETSYWMNPTDVGTTAANRKKLSTLPQRRAIIADYDYWWNPATSHNHGGSGTTVFRLDGSVTWLDVSKTKGLASWNWSLLDDVR